MADIREKIKKLLALASSSNEHEARSALLKARQLMMENKISESEIEDKGDLVHLDADVKWTTDSGEVWLVELCELIASNYCCVAAWRTEYGCRTHTLCVTGLEQDAEICKSNIEFAVGFVRGKIKILQRKYGSQDAKSLSQSYAKGFILGLEMELESQKEEHPEWGLVVVQPKEVQEYSESLSHRNVKSRKADFNPLAYANGQRDGREFSTKKAIGAVN